jgi:ABC-type lipoprotein export system ATPase subunit
VLVTHEPDIAEYGTRIVSFRDGRVRADQAVGVRRRAEHERAALEASTADDERVA